MLYLLTHHWIWLAAAFVIGAALPLVSEKLGWAADVEDYWLRRIGVVIAILVVLVAAQVFAGHAALMLEAATGLALAFVLGGVAGGLKSRMWPARFEGWWVGLFATFLLWAVFGITLAPKFAPDLRERVTEVVKAGGADPLNFDVAGRDVLLPADLGDKRAALATEIKKVAGVRQVTEVDDLTGPALAAKTIAKLQAEAEAKAAAAKEAEAKEAAAKEAADKAAAEKAAAEKLAAAKAKETADKHAADKAAADKAAAKAAADKAAADKAAADKAAAEDAARKAAADEAAKQAAAAKPAEVKTAAAGSAVPAPEVQACQTSVSAIVTAQKINFERGSAEIDKASQEVLGKLAAAISKCPAVSIEVAGHTDANGKKANNEALSKQRAEAVVASLSKIGVGATKLTAAGYGSDKPLAGNDTAEGRAKNRRIEFVVK